MSEECKQCQESVRKKVKRSRQALGGMVIPYERPRIEGTEAMPEMVTIKMAKGYLIATHRGHEWQET